jgi:pimeloyl-ACP methyl ester carboxylesterase
MREVIVLHGLWVPGLAMSPLAARLAAEGFRCHLFRYTGRGHPLEANAERLLRFAHAVGPAHFVGHSLGGLVILEALGAAPGMAAGKVVLLGVPATGSFSGRRFAGHRFGRWLLGRSESLWRERGAARWTRPEPLGVIAGTMPLGLGRALGRLPGPNDGVVCVEETAVEGMRERIVLPVSHGAMILSARVAAQTAEFLRRGRFRHDANQ